MLRGRATDQFMDAAWVHLHVQMTSHWILPAHREGLDMLILPRREVFERNLKAILPRETVRSEQGGESRTYRVGGKLTDSIPSPVGRLFAVPIATYGCGMYLTRIRTAKDLYSAGSRSNMTFPETTESAESGQQRSCALGGRSSGLTRGTSERNFELVAGSVVVPDNVAAARRHRQSVEGGHFRRVALVPVPMMATPRRIQQAGNEIFEAGKRNAQGGIHVPAVKAGESFLGILV